MQHILAQWAMGHGHCRPKTGNQGWGPKSWAPKLKTHIFGHVCPQKTCLSCLQTENTYVCHVYLEKAFIFLMSAYRKQLFWITLAYRNTYPWWCFCLQKTLMLGNVCLLPREALIFSQACLQKTLIWGHVCVQVALMFGHVDLQKTRILGHENTYIWSCLPAENT